MHQLYWERGREGWRIPPGDPVSQTQMRKEDNPSLLESVLLNRVEGS